MYSVSSMKSGGKPPLAKSPMRLRPRRVLRPSNSFSLQTPPPPRRGMGWEGVEECELRPEYRTISCELRALTNMVREELGKRDRDGENIINIAFGNGVGVGVDSHSLFERGRLYDAYSAKRNERLKRKKTGGDDVKAATYNYSYSVGVAAECTPTAKKSRSTEKVESLRKSMQAEPPRYMLRSRTKGDNNLNLNLNLPPLPPTSNSKRSSPAAPGVHNKIGGSTSRLRRIWFSLLFFILLILLLSLLIILGITFWEPLIVIHTPSSYFLFWQYKQHITLKKCYAGLVIEKKMFLFLYLQWMDCFFGERKWIHP